MKQDAIAVWNALSVLCDYFALMGGSARYIGMSDSDILLYIAVSLAQRTELVFNTNEFENLRFEKSAAPVLRKVNEHLNAIKSTDEALIELLEDFIHYADPKLKPKDRSYDWVCFINQCRSQQMRV